MSKLLVVCIAAAAFCAAPALAADLPVKAPPIDAAPVFNWTGFYFGGQVGGGWGAITPTRIISGSPFVPLGFRSNTLHASGLLGGGYAGFNYQINRFVIGIDGDYSRANLSGSEFTEELLGSANDRVNHIDWIATLAGRFGYAVNDWMLFGKAGWAWEGFNSRGMNFLAGVDTVNYVVPEETRHGWTIGTGVEWSFARNWSAKLEYDYVKFNTINAFQINTNVATGIVTSGFPTSVVSSLNMLKLGIAYRY